MEPKEITEKIFHMYHEFGERDYIGEPVTQVEHMVQCAMLAEAEGYPDEVILGAFFHDVGHLLGMATELSRMESPDGQVLGCQDHDVIGAQFLRDLGLSEAICRLVEGHVQAKRYNVFKDDSYRKKLSQASKKTLECQGGPMTAEEARIFERSEHFELIRKVRSWDEQAKVTGMTIHPLERYEEMLINHLTAKPS